MRKIAGYLTKNRSGKDKKIAQSTHENGYIKPRKTFWRNSKQLLKVENQVLNKQFFNFHITGRTEVRPPVSGHAPEGLLSVATSSGWHRCPRY